MRASQDATPDAASAVVRELLSDTDLLGHMFGSTTNQLDNVRKLLDAIGPDWLRAVPTVCKVIHDNKNNRMEEKCNKVLGPLVAALGPIAEATASPTTSQEARETRREAIAAAIERVAEVQTDRSERDDDWIVSLTVTFDAGYQWTYCDKEVHSPRLGSTVGLALDSEVFGHGIPLWFHLMVGVFDTTQITTSELGLGSKKLDDTFGWEALFYPSARIGIGMWARTLPLSATVGLGFGRIEESADVITKPTILLGLSLGVPLIDLN